MHQIVLIRHGESAWNKENRFTGWTDVPLSEKGINEAREAGKLLKSEGFKFDYAFTSVLKRAIKTLWLVLEEMDLMWIPIQHSWKLNERHYGALQGLNKADTAAKFGDAQVNNPFLNGQLRNDAVDPYCRRSCQGFLDGLQVFTYRKGFYRLFHVFFKFLHRKR